jgi:hypothetical protein
MAISKNLSLPRPLNLPKPAPTAKPAQIQGGVAGQAAAPHKPATKPQGQLSRPSVDSFNPNAKPVNLPGAVGGGINPNTKPKPSDRPIVGINPNTPNGGVIIPGGGWANPQRTELPPTVGINPNTPNGGVIIPGGGWANPQRTEKPEVTGPAIGGRNPHATGDINTHGKPTPPEPWTTYGEALEQNRDVIPDLNTYDLGAAFDNVFDRRFGGAELVPGGGWGDLVEANKDSIPPGWFDNK